MKYLVIGSGGREHALGWKLKQVEGSEVHFLPGNGGTLHIEASAESILPIHTLQLVQQGRGAVLQIGRGCLPRQRQVRFHAVQLIQAVSLAESPFPLQWHKQSSV